MSRAERSAARTRIGFREYGKIPRKCAQVALVDAIRVRGGRPLSGRIQVGGAKNAALPILCATLLSDGESRLRNVPGLRDIDTTAELLRVLGRDVTLAIPEVTVAVASRSASPTAPNDA